jgi:hypothetical protein
MKLMIALRAMIGSATKARGYKTTQQAVRRGMFGRHRPMANLKVWTFFYGSFINLDVLGQVGYTPDRFKVARLSGFDIRIEPLANLVRSDQHSVYGIVAPATHEELRRLYAQEWVGTYLPEPVVVETLDAKLRAAFCYIAPSPEPRPATNDYIDRIVTPARQHGFPEWYIARLESFRPQVTLPTSPRPPSTPSSNSGSSCLRGSLNQVRQELQMNLQAARFGR